MLRFPCFVRRDHGDRFDPALSAITSIPCVLLDCDSHCPNYYTHNLSPISPGRPVIRVPVIRVLI